MSTTVSTTPIALHQLNLLQAPPSAAFDRITRLAAQAFAWHGQDMAAAISLTDATCQWLVSRTGTLPPMTPRDPSPCYAIAHTGQPLTIADLATHPDHQASLLAGIGMRFYAGAPLLTQTGASLGAICVMSPAPTVATATDMALLQDLAALVMDEIELHHAGRIDPISGLPNRRQLLEEIEDLAIRQAGHSRLLALIDLAQPHELASMLHTVGSACLDEMVQRDAVTLRSILDPMVRLFHVAQTQFALLAPPGTSPGELAIRLQYKLSGAVLGRDALFSTTCTTGITAITPGEVAPSEMLRRAHAALDNARARNEPIGFWSRDQDDAFRRAFTILNDFGAALVDGSSLRLVFQPRLDLATGRCVGAEALIRWTHPKLGEVPPSEFVRLIEKTTLTRGLMHWVLDRALAQLREWRAAGIHLQLSINVSPANLEDPGLTAHILATLDRFCLKPTVLELEITESALLNDAGPALQHLRALSQAGISIAIDDFGTGYSSLSYLQRLPADVVKIDQSFVRGLSKTGIDEGRLRTLVAAMIGLSHELGYRVVAEGIETQDAADVLRGLNCDEVQGYWFARPMPPATFKSWYEQRPWVSTRRATAGSPRRLSRRATPDILKILPA
jgi:EAL domain-containing protein (putative c-di-GMP-specific phosphodiesterase class I)